MSIYDKIISAFGMLRDIIAGKAEKSDIAPEFSTSSTYGEGTLVMKDGTLYRCTSLHSGAWDASNFSATTVDGALAMIPQSDKAAEEANADVHDVIDAEYTVVNQGDAVEVHVAAEDPYAAAEEMSPGNVSTAYLKGDVKLFGISVCDIKNIEDASYMFAGNTGIKKCTVPDWFNPGKMDYMFKMCTSLEQVDFSNHDIRIDGTRNTSWSAEGMFLGCSNLSSVCMDEEGYSSIKFCSRFGSIRDFFKGCYTLDKVKFRATYHTSDVPSEEDYAIAAEIKSASGLFGNCVNLTEAHIEGFSIGYIVDGFIGDSTYSSLIGMFDGCNSLRSISFKLVSGYENEAFLPFSGLVSLESVTLDSVFYMGSYFDPKWFDGTPLKEISILFSFSNTYFDSTLLPKTLTSVKIVSSFKWESSKEFDAFRDNKNIESLTLRDGLLNGCTNLTGAFMDCTSLSNAEILSSESSYASYMFKGCRSLLSCTVDGMIGGKSDRPDVVETFYGCEALTSLKLPECFGEGATDASRCFAMCLSLLEIDAKEIGASPDCCNLNSCFSMNLNGVPAYGVVTEISVSGSFGTQEGVDLGHCFRDCFRLRTCSLPATFGVLASCVSGCFKGCWAYNPSLSAYFGKSASHVDSCFCGCSSIENLDLSGGFGTSSKVLSVEDCFYGCNKLESLELSNDFGSSANTVYACFGDCKKLKSLPKFSGFGSSAYDFAECFKNCKELTSLSLPADFGSKAENVDYCFDHCTKLESITAIKFPVSFSLACCPLTAKSAKIVLNGLVDVSNKTTQTLELSYTTLESLSEEDISIASDKNWSVVTGTCYDE